jgi:hypothetical protein
MIPRFLNLEHVLRIHRSMIERYGGSEGVLDTALLQSAIAMPQASFGGEYLHADILRWRLPISTTLFRTTHSSMATSGQGRPRPLSSWP